jgi:hypothetical protein
MLDYREIPEDGEVWEQFAQDFFMSMGLAIESPPDRGADGGKDILMLETLNGPTQSTQFRWLVSCKHTAHSGVAISEITHEKNILERVKSFRADGFIGFYSTLPTAGLNTRLRNLTDSQQIQNYRIFSGKLIENELLTIGRSWIIRRYLPNSYKVVRPIHLVLDEYIPLKCRCCDKNLLVSLFTEHNTSLISFVYQYRREESNNHYIDVYWACKGECDRILQDQVLGRHDATTSWKDISDIAMPNEFLLWLYAILNKMRDGETYSDKAFANLKDFIGAISQKVFREVTDQERKRLREMMRWGF